MWLWFYAGFINFNNFHCLLFFKIKLISKIEKMQSLIRIEEMVFRGKLIIQELMVVCFCWIFLQIHVRDKNKYKNKQKTTQCCPSLIKDWQLSNKNVLILGISGFFLLVQCTPFEGVLFTFISCYMHVHVFLETVCVSKTINSWSLKTNEQLNKTDALRQKANTTFHLIFQTRFVNF